MIYLVTKEQDVFNHEDVNGLKEISLEESLQMMSDWKIVQLDSETTGGLEK